MSYSVFLVGYLGWVCSEVQETILDTDEPLTDTSKDPFPHFVSVASEFLLILLLFLLIFELVETQNKKKWKWWSEKPVNVGKVQNQTKGSQVYWELGSISGSGVEDRRFLWGTSRSGRLESGRVATRLGKVSHGTKTIR